MFEVGEKIVCVDDSPIPKQPKGDILVIPSVMVVKGRIYVVREVFPKANGVHLVGLEGATVLGSGKLGNIPWNCSRFRRLSDMQEEARSKKESHKLEPV